MQGESSPELGVNKVKGKLWVQDLLLCNSPLTKNRLQEGRHQRLGKAERSLLDIRWQI